MRFWLARRGLSQVDLVRAINARRRAQDRRARLVQGKTISLIVRGYHTQTRLLAEIAAVLDVPIDAVLIAPDRRPPTPPAPSLMNVADLVQELVRVVRAHDPTRRRAR